MTVQELIDALQAIENKNLKVFKQVGVGDYWEVRAAEILSNDGCFAEAPVCVF